MQLCFIDYSVKTNSTTRKKMKKNSNSVGPTSNTCTPTDHKSELVPSNHCCEGDFVALRLAKYEDEIPQIGKVVMVDDMNVTIEWWIGRFNSTWICWRKHKGVPVEETFPKNADIYRIKFTKSMRLNTTLQADLKHIYENIEFV